MTLQHFGTSNLYDNNAITKHKPHYPFEIPDSWEWIRLENFVLAVTDGDHFPPPQAPSGIPFLVISDVNTGRISFDKARFVSECYYKALPEIRKAKEGDLLFTVTGSYGIVIPVNTNRKFCFQRHIGLIKTITSSSWIRFVLQSNYVQSYCDSIATGTAQKTVSLGHLRNLIIPIPPEKEQVRIINELELWLNKVEIIQRNECDLKRLLSFAKSIILDLSIHGNLVPQDYADEPAEVLLQRVNPNAVVSADKSHYDLPDSYCVVTLKDICKIISAKPFQIAQKQIQSKGKYPVVSQSANFIEGYTDSGCAYKIKTPIILFGDHTRNVKFIDFDFVVGADGTKLLLPLVLPQYVYLSTIYASNTIQNRGYSRHFSYLCKVSIPLPPLNEQKRIVAKVDELFAVIDQIQQSLE